MRWWFVLLAGCGRLGFDAQSRASDGGADSSSDGTAMIDGMVVPAGPAVWLRMETDPTQGIVDTGGGHSLSCAAGTCPTLAAGKHGMGYAFVDNQVDLAPAADLQAGSGFTAAFWVKITTLPAQEACPWNKTFDATKTYDTFALCIDTNGTVIYDGETQGGTTVSETSAAISLGQWHHVAVSWDGTTKRDWLDGAQIGSDTLVPGTGNMGLTLGGAGNAWYLQGTLDDAMFYTRALSTAEIEQLAAP